MTRDSSPSFLARQLLRRLQKNHGSFEHLECYFDVGRQMHERRQEVALVRASRIEALTAENVREIEALRLGTISPAHLDMEMPWDLLLRTSETKMQCWELLARALFKCAIIKDIGTVKVHSQNYSESVGDVTETRVHWGEADMLCAGAAAQLESVLIETIDYDMVLQSLIGMPSAAEGTRWIQFKAEAIDSGLLSSMYGSLDQRLHASVLLLCAFKSDYSKPICKKVGMTTKQLVAHMRKANGEACLTEVARDGKTCLLFSPPKLLKCLRKAPPLDAIKDILWCIAYFRGYGAELQPPGPVLEVPADALFESEIVVCANTL